MTIVGGGGVSIKRWSKSKRFHKDYDALTNEYKDKVDQKLQDLSANPRPPGLRFEKLKGHDGIYTIHVDGNYKVSMNIVGDKAVLRRVSNHDDIDRAP